MLLPRILRHGGLAAVFLLAALTARAVAGATTTHSVVIDGIRFDVDERPGTSRVVVSIAGVSPHMAMSEHSLILGIARDVPKQASFERAARWYLGRRGGACRIVDSVEWRQSQRWFTIACAR